MQLRWYQKESVEIVLNRVLSKEKESHPIIAVPTGAGKTIMSTTASNEFISEAKKDVLFLSHNKEILKQLHDSVRNNTDREVGLYSSGLDSKTRGHITIAGIQSVYRKPHLFKNAGLVIIDECHLVNDLDAGMYRNFLKEIKNANYVGYTATPYRSRGMLHKAKDGLFNELAYNLTDHKNFSRLVEEGYLTKLYSKSTLMEMNTKGIRTVAGDFKLSDLDIAFNQEIITNKALDEVMEYGKKYKKWLIFGINIDHAESINKRLNELGIKSNTVHSKMTNDRDTVIRDFRNGKYRALTNVDILTTGIDVPDIDLIVLLRPTRSPTIYVQSVGRGLRVAKNKDHCLVLDFAGNTERLGPIDNIDIREKGEPKSGEPITKECPNCKCIHHPLVKVCNACGYEFQFKVHISSKTSEFDIAKRKESQWVDVNSVRFYRHKKKNAPDSIRIEYKCGLRIFKQWLAVQSYSSYARSQSIFLVEKFLREGIELEKYDVGTILNNVSKLKTPNRIFVNVSDRYPEVQSIDFGEGNA